MKKVTLKLLLLITSFLFAQNQGDIAFVGYNADGDDDFAIVVLSDIPAGTTIYFTDSEPNDAGTGMNDTSEGVVSWATGGSVINAGTVVAFTDIDNESNESFGASIGTITRSTPGIELASSSGGDELFATLGNPATDEVTVWLTGIEVHDNGRPLNFSQTGLTPGTDYLVMDKYADANGAKYIGSRTGKTVSEYKSLINTYHQDQWDASSGDGESLLPFETTPFQFITLYTDVNTIEGVILSVKNRKIITNKGTIVSVQNMLGQQVLNQNLIEGIYIVTVVKDNVTKNYTFAM